MKGAINMNSIILKAIKMLFNCQIYHLIHTEDEQSRLIELKEKVIVNRPS